MIMTMMMSMMIKMSMIVIAANGDLRTAVNRMMKLPLLLLICVLLLFFKAFFAYKFKAIRSWQL